VCDVIDRLASCDAAASGLLSYLFMPIHFILCAQHFIKRVGGSGGLIWMNAPFNLFSEVPPESLIILYVLAKFNADLNRCVEMEILINKGVINAPLGLARCLMWPI